MDIERINLSLDELASDQTVPRNIRSAIQNAKAELNNPNHELRVRISSAISILDECSNDPNIPMYTRTQIMTIVSQLEALRQNAPE
jgi:uncharacterized protein (UPF0147 family)